MLIYKQYDVVDGQIKAYDLGKFLFIKLVKLGLIEINLKLLWIEFYIYCRSSTQCLL
jgi:hypothetical protein